jgi:hypothetical protein
MDKKSRSTRHRPPAAAVGAPPCAVALAAAVLVALAGSARADCTIAQGACDAARATYVTCVLKEKAAAFVMCEPLFWSETAACGYAGLTCRLPVAAPSALQGERAASHPLSNDEDLGDDHGG